MKITNKELVEQLAKNISLISRHVEHKVISGPDKDGVVKYIEYFDELRRRYTADIKVAQRNTMLSIISAEIDEYLDI